MEAIGFQTKRTATGVAIWYAGDMPNQTAGQNPGPAVANANAPPPNGNAPAQQQEEGGNPATEAQAQGTNPPGANPL